MSDPSVHRLDIVLNLIHCSSQASRVIRRLKPCLLHSDAGFSFVQGGHGVWLQAITISPEPAPSFRYSLLRTHYVPDEATSYKVTFADGGACAALRAASYRAGG